MREEVAQHEGGDAVAAVLLQHAQRQDVRDLGAVTEMQLIEIVLTRSKSTLSQTFHN